MRNSLVISLEKSGFTLLELIIVIVIIGILATLGFTQYNLAVEKGRIAEAAVNLGKMRKYAISYYLANGTLTGMTSSDLGIGAGADQIPGSCNSSTYFAYDFDLNTGTSVQLNAHRCTSGGKSPNFSGGYMYRPHYYFTAPDFNADRRCWDDTNSRYIYWCLP